MDIYESVRLVANRLISVGFDTQLFLSLFLIYFFWLFFTTTYSISRMMRSFFAGFFAAVVIFAATPFLAVYETTSFWPKLLSCLVVFFFR